MAEMTHGDANGVGGRHPTGNVDRHATARHRDPDDIGDRHATTEGDRRPTGIYDLHPTIDGVLEAWREHLGRDFEPYRNHVYRVWNLALALSPAEQDREGREDLIALAAVFHDLGIWSHGTLDYLRPSVRLAMDHLAEDERRSWARPVELMILMHHKLLPYRGEAENLVEPFRRADLCDLTRGYVAGGASADFVRELYRRFPDAGFRGRVVRLVAGWARSHPLHPLPWARI